MNKQDYHAAKDQLLKSVHDAANSLAGMNSPGNPEQFYKEIIEEIDALKERVWRIADRHRG